MSEQRGRGRPRAFDEDAALDAAMLTFWEKGYRNTSLDDLVVRTGASRASLYKTFGDKRDIFVQSLDLYGTRFEERAEAVLARNKNMLDTARILLTASAERLTGSDAPAGCLRCNTTLEILGSDAALDDALNQANARFFNVMKKVAARGVKTGEIAKRDAGDIAMYLNGAVSAMVNLSRTGATRAEMMRFVERTLRALTI